MRSRGTQKLKLGRGVKGFTILELMIVIAIMIVLGAMALPNLSALIPRYRLNSAAKDLAGAVQRARMMSITHGREYRIRMIAKDSSPASGSPSDSVGEFSLEAYDENDWDTLPIDSGGDTNGAEGNYVITPGNGAKSQVGISIVGWTPMGGPDVNNTNCIVFSPKGWIKNPTTDFDGGFIYVQFRNKYKNPQEEIRTVRISRGGGVSILHGAHGSI